MLGAGGGSGDHGVRRRTWHSDDALPLCCRRLIAQCSFVLLLCHTVCLAVAGDHVPGFEELSPQRTHRVLGGHTVQLDCFPSPVSNPPADVFIVQWKKQGSLSPVFLWRREKSIRKGRGYEGRVTLIGIASIQIDDVRPSDEGVYDCQVWDVNGRPYVNGTVVQVQVEDAVPRFSVQPKDTFAAINETAEFACDAVPAPATIRWLFDGRPCGAGVPPDAVVSDGRLRVTVSADANIRRLQIGQYNCVAEWESAVLYSSSANLTLAEIAPYREQEDIHISALEGGYAVISGAVPLSVPQAVISVTHNGTTLPSSSPRIILMPSGNLHIINVQASDSGAYRFTAWNPVTKSRVTAKNVVNLQVIAPDRNYSAQLLAAPKKMNEAILGANVSLECAASGNPLPRISWSKYGGLLPEGRYSQKLGNLFLYGLRENDTGTYVCEVENVVDLPVSTIAALEVLDAPEIHRWIEKYEVREREDLVLECHARGNTKPVVKWLHNGSAVVGSEMVVVRESKLNIRYAQREHAGLYQCFASNAAGVDEATALVRVIPFMAPDSDSDMGIAMASFPRGHRREHSLFHADRPWSSSSSQNSTLTFIKEDDGSVDVDDHETDHSQDYPIEDVNVDPYDQDEWPTQTAKRNQKKNRKKSKKRKLGAGEDGQVAVPPSRPEVTKLSDESVMVRWDVPPNSGLPILFFKVQYKDVTKRSNSRWMTIDEDIQPHVHSYEVMSLRTGRAYRFRIAAVYSNKDNKAGQNSARFVLLKDPPMKKPDVGPTIVHAEAIAPSAISLRWQYLDVDGVPVDGFFIYYRATTKAGDYTKITVLGANTLTYIISHLLPETAYDIKMQSFNSAGTSEFSNIHTEKTLVSPDSPRRESEDSFQSRPTPVSNTASSDRLLYTIFGSILVALTVALVSFIAYCSWKQARRQRRRVTNASKVIENGDDRGKYAAVNGNAGNGHAVANGGAGMFLWDKVVVENGRHRHRDAFPLEETSLVEVLPRIVRNNNNNEMVAIAGNDDQEEAVATACDIETENNEDESDLHSEVFRNQGTQLKTAVCKPLVHRNDHKDCRLSDPEDVDFSDTVSANVRHGNSNADVES